MRGVQCGLAASPACRPSTAASPITNICSVTGRPVKDRLLIGAVRAAYQDLLARDRHPVLALFIDLPGDEVDVNVHPAKTEVRFRDPGGIRGLIVGGLRHALDEGGHRSAQRPSAGALGNWQPEPMRSPSFPLPAPG